MRDFKYIDTVDLPSDPNGSLSNARTSLARAYNFNRNSPQKLQLLADTMLVVLKAITDGLNTVDPAEVVNYQAYKNDKVISATKTTPGFTKPEPKPETKPTRAAKRTPTRTK